MVRDRNDALRISSKKIRGATSIAALLAMGLLNNDAKGATDEEISLLKREIEIQRAATRRLEKKIETLMISKKKVQAKNLISNESTPIISRPVNFDINAPQPQAGYANGFFMRDSTGNNSLNINGLIQPRFSSFGTNGTKYFGALDHVHRNFDLFLGRLYFSGNVVDPSIQYFMTLQGTTMGNSTVLSLLDAKISKTFSPFFTLETGRFWSSYTYEYYVDIGKYLFPDLSAAEWAFSLGRQIGVRAFGKIGKLGYSATIANSTPGSDVPFTNNRLSQLSGVLNLNYDILEPYGYKETNPSPDPVRAPQLSLWASAMYNHVAHSSVFQNDLAGDKTFGGTASLNFRLGYISFQGSGYFKQTAARYDGLISHGAFNSYGWQEQIGFYLIPGTLEVAQRVDQVNWGLGQIPFTGGSERQWWAGPGNFSYRRLTEYTGGLNYYISGHNAKVQAAYSFLQGIGFNGRTFNGSRFILQSQVEF